MAIYSGFSMIFPLKIVIFHSYVKLPEGSFSSDLIGRNQMQPVSFRRLMKFLTSYKPWVDAPSSAVVIVSPQRVDFGEKARSNPTGNLVIFTVDG